MKWHFEDPTFLYWLHYYHGRTAIFVVLCRNCVFRHVMDWCFELCLKWVQKTILNFCKLKENWNSEITLNLLQIELVSNRMMIEKFYIPSSWYTFPQNEVRIRNNKILRNRMVGIFQCSQSIVFAYLVPVECCDGNNEKYYLYDTYK